MRKIWITVAVLGLILAATLIISLSFALSEDDAKADPGLVISEAIALSGADFFSFDLTSQGKMLDAMTTGSIALSLEGNDAWGAILGEEYEDMNLVATAYSNAFAGKYALSLDGDVAGRELYGQAFLDGGAVTLQSESLFGSGTPYSFTPSVIAEKLKDSALCEVAGISPEDADEICELMRSFLGGSGGEPKSKKYFEALDYEVTGRQAGVKPLVVITLTVNGDTLSELITLCKEDSRLIGDESAEFECSMDKLLEAANSAELDIYVHISVDRWSRKLHGIEADIEISPRAGEYKGVTFSGKAAATITADEVSACAFLDGDADERLHCEISVLGVNNVSGGIVKYTLRGDTLTELGDAREEKSLFDASFEYNKSDYDFEFRVQIADMNVDAECKGEMIPDSDGVTVRVKRIGANGIYIDPGFGIRYSCDAQMPPAPDGVVEFVELDESELRRIFHSLGEGLDLS